MSSLVKSGIDDTGQLICEYRLSRSKNLLIKLSQIQRRHSSPTLHEHSCKNFSAKEEAYRGGSTNRSNCYSSFSLSRINHFFIITHRPLPQSRRSWIACVFFHFLRRADKLNIHRAIFVQTSKLCGLLISRISLKIFPLKISFICVLKRTERNYERWTLNQHEP
jgi:hypothetical protein